MTGNTKRNRVNPLQPNEIKSFSFNESFGGCGSSFRAAQIYGDKIVFSSNTIPGCGFTLTLDKIWTGDAIRGRGTKALREFVLDRRRIRQRVVSCFSFGCGSNGFVDSYRFESWYFTTVSADLSFRLCCF